MMAVTVQELSDLRGHARWLEESLANATSAHKESLSTLTREHERLQEELSRTKTSLVRCPFFSHNVLSLFVCGVNGVCHRFKSAMCRRRMCLRSTQT
jgi:hypothetical protein